MVKWNIRALLIIGMVVFSCDREEPEIAESIAGNRVTSIYIDAEGIRWFATENGLSAWDGSVWKNYTPEDGLPAAQIRDIAERLNHAGGQLLIGTEQGAGIVEKVRNLIQSVELWFTSNSGLAGDSITALMHDHEDVTWFGTGEGISVQRGNQWLEGEENSFLKDYVITDIAPGPDTISFVCFSGLGIALMNPSVDAVTTVTYYQWPFSPLPSDNIEAIYVEDYHHQWIGTDNGLAFHGNFDPKQMWELYDEEDGLVNNHVLSIQGDGNGVIWIGTVNGISRFDGEDWTNYGVEDGLAGDTVFSIAVDHDGSVWFGTNDGASLFDGSSWINYSKCTCPPD